MSVILAPNSPVIEPVEKPKVTKGAISWVGIEEDAVDIMLKELTPVVEIVEGFVTEEAKTMIGGAAKTNKTWISLAMALCIASGTPFIGRKVLRRKVLYANFELRGNTFDLRLQLIAKALGITIERGWFVHLPLRGKMTDLTTNLVVDRLIQQAIIHSTKVVFVDPFYKLSTEGDENSARDITILCNFVDRLTTQSNCAIVACDHFSKGSQALKEPLDAIRGSSAKVGDFDAIAVIRKHAEEECFSMHVTHRELPPVTPFVFEWQFPTAVERPDLNPDNLKQQRTDRKKDQAHDLSNAALLSLIRETTPSSPITITEWAKRSTFTRPVLSKRLPEMKTSGWITEVGNNTNKRVYITPFGIEAANASLDYDS